MKKLNLIIILTATALLLFLTSCKKKCEWEESATYDDISYSSGECEDTEGNWIEYVEYDGEFEYDSGKLAPISSTELEAYCTADGGVVSDGTCDIDDYQ